MRTGGKYTLQRPKATKKAKDQDAPSLSTSTSSRLAGLMRTGGKYILQRPKARAIGPASASSYGIGFMTRRRRRRRRRSLLVFSGYYRGTQGARC